MKKFTYSFVLCMAFLCMSATVFSQHIQGTYAIKNIETGMVLRIKDANKSNGTPLVAYYPVNWKCVTWDFKHVHGQSYQLKNLFTGKTFQAVNPTPSDGASLQQESLIANQANQQYDFISVQKNVYLIRLKGTNLYITPSDSKGTINSEIILAKKTGGKLQQWEIYEQKPTM